MNTLSSKNDILKLYFYVLLRVHLSISLDNDQLDAHLLYFTIRPLQSSTCFEHYMLIIRRVNCTDAASGIVLSVGGRSVYKLREFSLNLFTERQLTERTIPDAASMQLTSWWWAFNPYPTAFPYGNGMVLHFYQQQESSMTKTVHKVINKRLKAYV